MSIWGKLIGGAAGMALGGPIGAILGIAAGHGVDKVSKFDTDESNKNFSNDQKEQIFATSVIAISAKLAKVDGKISKSEILAFKKIFEFPAEDEKAISNIFNSAKENIDDYKDADFPMLPTQESKKRTAIFIGVYSCATVITSILLAPILQLGITYLVLALLFGIYLMYKSYGLYVDKVKPISYFIFSNTYLAVIFLSMVGDIFITLGSI